MHNAPDTLPEVPSGENGLRGLALNYRMALMAPRVQAAWEELDALVREYGKSCYRAGLERGVVVARAFANRRRESLKSVFGISEAISLRIAQAKEADEIAQSIKRQQP